MDADEVIDRVATAVSELYRDDYFLLNSKAGERAITVRLGVLLTPLFPGYSVDGEYEGAGDRRKELDYSEKQKSLHVRPDIIVHERGHNARNLLVIEAKRGERRTPDPEDLKKLQAFGEQLGYRYGVFLRLGIQECKVARFFDSGTEEETLGQALADRIAVVIAQSESEETTP